MNSKHITMFHSLSAILICVLLNVGDGKLISNLTGLPSLPVLNNTFRWLYCNPWPQLLGQPMVKERVYFQAECSPFLDSEANLSKYSYYLIIHLEMKEDVKYICSVRNAWCMNEVPPAPRYIKITSKSRSVLENPVCRINCNVPSFYQNHYLRLNFEIFVGVFGSANIGFAEEYSDNNTYCNLTQWKSLTSNGSKSEILMVDAKYAPSVSVTGCSNSREGRSCEIQYSVIGNPTPDIQCQYKAMFSDEFKLLPTTQSIMRFSSLSRFDSGHYFCHVNNSLGDAEDSFQLLVIYAPVGIGLDSGSDTRKIVYADIGDDAEIFLTVHAYPNQVRFSWKFNITGSLSITTHLPRNISIFYVLFEDIEEKHFQTYTIVARNGHGELSKSFIIDLRPRPNNNKSTAFLICVGIAVLLYVKCEKWRTHQQRRSADITLCQRIERHEFNIENTISYGKYSSLHIGVYDKTRCSVIKSSDPGEIPWILCQLRALQSIGNHANIVEAIAYHVSQDETIIFMLLKHMENGDLKTYLNLKSKTEKCKEEQHLHFANQIASGMKFISQQNQVKVGHLQLSASNVLLDGTLTCKLKNFASAKEIRKRRNQLISTNDLTILPWMSPECLVSEVNHNSASDVWAFGVLLYEIATNGGDPYPDLKLEDIGSYVLEGNIMQAPDNSDHMYKIMKRCWSYKKVERPSWEDLLLDIIHQQAKHSSVLDLGFEIIDNNIYQESLDTQQKD